MIHATQGIKPHRTQLTRMCHLPCLCALTCPSVRTLLPSPEFPRERARPKCPYCQGHLCPFFFCPFPQPVPSLRPLGSLNRHRAGKGRKTRIFDVFWPFLQGQSWKGSSQETTESSAKKKVDGQRLCQTNSCCCSCWVYLPNKSWSIGESHLRRFSGIYVPGRSSGQGVEPQDMTETNGDYSELIRLGEQGISFHGNLSNSG